MRYPIADADLEESLMKEKIDVHMLFFSFLCSGILDLALRILKMLTHLTICLSSRLTSISYIQ